MSKLIKLVNSPFQSPVDYACGLIFQIHVPYSKDGVSLLVNPSVADYIEKDGNESIDVRQLIVSEHTKDTKQIYLDFGKNNTKIIDNSGQQVEVKLMRIDTEKIEGQDFMFFELFVSEV